MKYRPSTTVKVLIAAVLVAPLAIPINDYREKRQIQKTFAEYGLAGSFVAEEFTHDLSPEQIKNIPREYFIDLHTQATRAQTQKVIYRGKAYTGREWSSVSESLGHNTAAVSTVQMDCHGIAMVVFDSRTEHDDFSKKTKADDKLYFDYQQDRTKWKYLSTEVGRAEACQKLYPERPTWIPACLNTAPFLTRPPCEHRSTKPRNDSTYLAYQQTPRSSPAPSALHQLYATSVARQQIASDQHVWR